MSKLKNNLGGSGGLGETELYSPLSFFLSNQKSDYKWIKRQFWLNLHIISVCRQIALDCIHPCVLLPIRPHGD